ncbi:hypothetical protein OS493_033938 [Desmophyllum pertusum]|uniref:Uncharacterized protein n=1 Tax=Desmophyllum pertusum TaxID=174260 RepID=A0A9W9ZWB6_9CNID|nr:hypothetical protein OS493_033938 [Desmophyllum pertusum]
MEVIRSVSDRFNVTLSSLERIIKRVSQAVIALRQGYLKWPKAPSSKRFFRKINLYVDITSLTGGILTLLGQLGNLLLVEIHSV